MTTVHIKSTNQPLPLSLPGDCLKVLYYLLYLPNNSKLNIKDLCLTLLISKHARQVTTGKLQAFGYLQIQRLSNGHTIWHVYDTPQPIKPKTKGGE